MKTLAIAGAVVVVVLLLKGSRAPATVQQAKAASKSPRPRTPSTSVRPPILPTRLPRREAPAGSTSVTHALFQLTQSRRNTFAPDETPPQINVPRLPPGGTISFGRLV